MSHRQRARRFLVRLSHSHIRIGSFQRLAYMDDMDGIEMLARHVARHYFGGAAKPNWSKITTDLMPMRHWPSFCPRF